MVIARPFSYSFAIALKASRTVGGLLAAIQTTLRRLFSPCLFGHGQMLRTRDEDGYLALQCMDCWHSTRVLEQPTIRGPQQHPAVVKGAPLVKVTRPRAEKRSYPRLA